MNPAAIILTIEIGVIIAVAITCLVYAHRLELAHKRSGEMQAREFSDAIELGGAADSIPFHDPLIIEGAQRDHA